MRIENGYQFIEKGYCEHFVLEEWPIPEDLKFVDYRVIEALDDLRGDFGFPIFPSKKPAGLVRRDGSTTSRHYIGDGRLGLAVDIFPSVNALDCWITAIENKSWRGIGVYLDTIINNSTQPQPMLHLDIDPNRTQRTFWIRSNKKYILKSSSPKKFWGLLSNAWIER